MSEYNAIGMELTLPKGAIILHENDPSHYVFVVRTGQVKLSCDSKEGKVLILKIAMAGEVLGLGAAVSGSVNEMTAETLIPTHVKTIGTEDFLAFMRKYREVSMLVAEALSQQYKAAFFSARFLGISATASSKLAAVLLDWGERVGSNGKQGVCFRMALTHEEMGNLAGMTRETVTRVLSAFQKNHLIEVRGSSICIVAPGGLQRLTA